MTTRYGENPEIKYNSTDETQAEDILAIALQVKQTLEQGGRILLLTPDSQDPQELTLEQEV